MLAAVRVFLWNINCLLRGRRGRRPARSELGPLNRINREVRIQWPARVKKVPERRSTASFADFRGWGEALSSRPPGARKSHVLRRGGGVKCSLRVASARVGGFDMREFAGKWLGPLIGAMCLAGCGFNRTPLKGSTLEQPSSKDGTGSGAVHEPAAGSGGRAGVDAWPPKDATVRRLYLRANGRLAFDPPAASSESAGVRRAARDSMHSSAFDAFVSDPAHPVPYSPRPDNGEGWSTWLVQDQRFVEKRPDVLSWTSEPLDTDLTIAGDVVAHLFASTTGTDADWVVKLIDVYPDTVPDRPRMAGYELMVNADIVRGRYWKGFAKATPIPADTVTPFTVDLHGQLYRFRKGHRLMVQVQSSWFPLYDRNPQRFVPNVFMAKADDFRAQVHRVWHTAGYPSHVGIAVMP